MSKTLVIYWSGTGNTKAMAEAITKGAGDAQLLSVDAATIDDVKNADRIAFGCPSMGDEVLEESEMEPFFTEAEQCIGGKNVGLFGSYGWGDGQWMRDWEERTRDSGARLLRDEGLSVNETPSEDDLAACEAFGKELASV